MDRSRFPSRMRALFVLAAVILSGLALPATARAAVSESYSFVGVEVWATSTVGTFVGTATGSDGDLATWKSSIEHTVQTIPEGSITGGNALLVTSDLTRIRGAFSGGKLRLVSDGSGSCGDLVHKVRGRLANVTRSDNGKVGSGLLVGRLVHYRVSILGRCVAYSASASGTITLSF